MGAMLLSRIQLLTHSEGHSVSLALLLLVEGLLLLLAVM